LINDADLRSRNRHPHLFWWMLALCVIVLGTWWWTSSDVEVSTTASTMRTTENVAPHVAEVTEAPTQVMPTTPHTTLDPRSILVLSLTDEELAAFGITRIGDTVVVPMQSLVVEDPKIAQTLGLDSAQLADTTALFHWSSRSFPGRVDSIKAISFDGTTLDHLSPILVYSIKGNYIAPSAMIYPALVRTDLQDSLLGALMQAEPSLYHAVAPHGGMLAMMPAATLRRDRKPIMIQVHTPGSEHRTQIEFMPTDAVLTRLPIRFQRELAVCYAPYQPALPRKYTPVRFPNLTAVRLKKVNGVVGQPFIELTPDNLRSLTILQDSVTIRSGNFGYTIDSSRTTMTTATHFRAQVPYLTQMLFARDTMFRYSEIRPIALQNDVECRGNIDTVKSGLKAMMYSISTTTSDDWTDKYPKAVDFLHNTVQTIMSKGIPIDSIAYYWVSDHNLELPIARFLIVLRIATPWTSSPAWNGESRRLVHFNWYLPTQQVLDALPENISAFLRPEFEAMYSSIEHELTMSEMCAMLEKPSALGLCTITDSTLRIDGIGPIPARDVFTVFVHSSSPTIAALQLVGDDARVLLELNNIQISQGANQIPIPIANENIPSGAYTVVLTTREGTRTSRVLIQR
jgi:hypothetical protein